MRPVLALLLVLLVLPAAAAAPAVDVEALCRDLAWTGTHTSTTILAECRRWEAQARSDVEPGWETLSPRIRRHCGRLAFTNRTGSYHALAECAQVTGGATPAAPHLGP